jgi:hypothetical protein
MSSIVFVNYSNQFDVLLKNIVNASGIVNKANAINSLFKFILDNKDTLRNEFNYLNRSNDFKHKMAMLYEAILEKSFEIYNLLIKYNIKDDTYYALCVQVYEFAKNDLIKYFNYSNNNQLFYTNLLKPRINNETINLDVVAPRRSARIAAKAAKV